MKLQALEIVILTETYPTKHFETGEPIILQQGQVGTIVMELGEGVFEVEFADQEGIPYTIETLSAKQLRVLHHEPLPA
jgi:hypothetical protein